MKTQNTSVNIISIFQLLLVNTVKYIHVSLLCVYIAITSLISQLDFMDPDTTHTYQEVPGAAVNHKSKYL